MHAFEDQLVWNYAGILDVSLNAGYSSTSFKLVVVSAVMPRQLTLFGKVPVSRKVYGKTDKQLRTICEYADTEIHAFVFNASNSSILASEKV